MLLADSIWIINSFFKINNWNWSEDIYNERSIDEQVNESEHVKEAELELPATIEAEKKSTDGNVKPTVKFSETDIQLLARGYLKLLSPQ